MIGYELKPLQANLTHSKINKNEILKNEKINLIANLQDKAVKMSATKRKKKV
jgi:hypothetical protein